VHRGLVRVPASVYPRRREHRRACQLLALYRGSGRSR